MSRRKSLLVQQRLWMFVNHNPIEGYTGWVNYKTKSINYVACIFQPYKILNMGGSSVTSNPMEYQDQANSSFGIHQCLSKQNCSIHFLRFQIHPKKQKKLR